MHDEVCPTYQDMLVNLQKGHMYLKETFDYKPRVAWSIETSGHSLANPRLLAESGIEALYMLNIDPEEKEKRIKESSMEFIWRPMYWHLARRAQLFTHVIYDFDLSLLDFHISDELPIDPTPPIDDNGNNTVDDDDILPDEYDVSFRLAQS